MAAKKGTLVSCPSTMDDVLQHAGHEIECVYYGKSKRAAQNAAIECVTCGCVILDIDANAGGTNR